MYAISIMDQTGYTDFYNFRKKYKMLENITKKQDFNLDHRLKVIEGNNTFFFTMEANDQSKFFFTGRKLKIELEEIYSI